MGSEKANGAEGEGAGTNSWYNRNNKVIRWGTMIGSWAVGITCIATGVGVVPGVAIISAGSAFAGAKPAKTWWQSRKKDT